MYLELSSVICHLPNLVSFTNWTKLNFVSLFELAPWIPFNQIPFYKEKENPQEAFVFEKLMGKKKQARLTQ